jgi:hypothetical protein
VESYKSRSPSKAGAVGFEIGEDYILVEFVTGGIYLYNYLKPGRSHVEEMKKLALAQKGLSTYITQRVKKNYAAKR